MVPTGRLFSFLFSRSSRRPSVLAGRNYAFNPNVRHSGSMSFGKRDRLIYGIDELINTEGIPWLTQERIKEFGNKIGFPVHDCKIFKYALSVNPDSNERSWNVDLRDIGTDALRLVLADYFSQLRYYSETKSESVSAANRVLRTHSAFRRFALQMNLQEYLIYDDKPSLKTQPDDLKLNKECSQMSRLETPLSVNSELLLHNVSLSVAGAIYLDSADTAEVRSIFFPFLGDVLEKEKRATMAKLGISYEDTTPEAFERWIVNSYAEQYGDDIVGLMRALK